MARIASRSRCARRPTPRVRRRSPGHSRASKTVPFRPLSSGTVCDIRIDMSDPRVAKLADLLVNYSVGLKPGQLVRIDAATVAAPLVTEVYRHALRAGAHPRTRIEIEGLDVIAVGEASDEQLSFVSELDRFEVEQLAAIMTIWGDRNTRALTQADPARISRRIASRRELNRRFWERIDAGEATWVGTRFPTDAHAQDAEMSLPEYEDFVYA